MFSPGGEDGVTKGRTVGENGKIERVVVGSWERYDIRLTLKRDWHVLAPKLRGKIRVYVGAEDTYRLEGAVKLLKAELEELGSDAEVVILEGRSHGSLLAPHSELWPSGLRTHIHQEMWKSWNPED